MERLVYFLRYIFLRFESNENRKNAASLTFVTLFALVPLMTVGYGVLKVFPQFAGISEQLHEFVFEHFVPTSVEVVKQYLQGFSEQASKLTWIGILTLIFSAFTLLLTIENAFNRVWRVTKKRSGVGRFLLYWTMLSLGPFLLGLGFIFSSYIISLPVWAETNTVSASIKILPFTFGTLALTLIYTVVPGCRVELKHAFLGALIAATLLEMGKAIFIWSVSSFPSYRLVYGAFAAIPLFLIWIYVAWCIVLLGAELVRALAFVKKEQIDSSVSDLDWILEILRVANVCRQKGLPLYRKSLTKELPLQYADRWEPLLMLLIKQNWIAQSSDDGYIILKDLHTMTLLEIINLLEQNHESKLCTLWRGRPWFKVLGPVFDQVTTDTQAALTISVYDVINDSQ